MRIRRLEAVDSAHVPSLTENRKEGISKSVMLKQMSGLFLQESVLSDALFCQNKSSLSWSTSSSDDSSFRPSFEIYIFKYKSVEILS